MGDIQGNGERVLVVDDLESQRTIATHLLRRLNYSAHAVNSGEAAVEYLKKPYMIESLGKAVKKASAVSDEQSKI